MKAFADLYTALDETTKTNAKVQALVRYLSDASSADAAWAVYFLIGRKPRQVVPTKRLRAWAVEEAGVPDWLFEESYDAVGDFAETIALLLPAPERSSDRALADWVARLLALREAAEEDQKAGIVGAWREMDSPQRFVWNKLISGAFRVGVSQQLVTRALAKVIGVDAAVVAHRLMGDWEPSAAFYDALKSTDATRRRRRPALPVLPGLSAGIAARVAGRGCRLAGGMEVGRHPRAAHPPRGAHVRLDAGRGARHRPISRTDRPGPEAARGHRARWRDPPLARRRAIALRPAPAPDRPEGARQGDPPRGARRPRRLRPAGRRRPRRPAADDGMAAGPARGDRRRREFDRAGSSSRRSSSPNRGRPWPRHDPAAGRSRPRA